MARNAAPEPGLTPLLNRLARLEAAVARIASQQRAPVAPVVSGAGKSTVTDADFESPQSDGAVALVLNTTNATTRLALRANGVWTVSAPLT